MAVTGNDTDIRYVVCVDNTDYEMDLFPLKVYAVLPESPEESALDLLRVVDETGEDYLYPAERFASVEVSGGGKENVRRLTLRK